MEFDLQAYLLRLEELYEEQRFHALSGDMPGTVRALQKIVQHQQQAIRALLDVVMGRGE